MGWLNSLARIGIMGAILLVGAGAVLLLMLRKCLRSNKTMIIILLVGAIAVSIFLLVMEVGPRFNPM